MPRRIPRDLDADRFYKGPPVNLMAASASKEGSELNALNDTFETISTRIDGMIADNQEFIKKHEAWLGDLNRRHS